MWHTLYTIQQTLASSNMTHQPALSLDRANKAEPKCLSREHSESKSIEKLVLFKKLVLFFYCELVSYAIMEDQKS